MTPPEVLETGGIPQSTVVAGTSVKRRVRGGGSWDMCKGSAADAGWN
jgi:hypothetical protein